MKLSWSVLRLDQDAALQPEHVSSRNKFCKVSLFSLAQVSKWKEQQIAWCEDKGEPSERVATHHTAAAADPERRVALISPDSTRWNSVAQSSSDWRTYACVSQAAATAETSLFWICETSLFSRKDHMTDGAQLWAGNVGFTQEDRWIAEVKIIKLHFH